MSAHFSEHDLMLRSRAQPGVSKHGLRTLRLIPSFETRRCASLLRMRLGMIA